MTACFYRCFLVALILFTATTSAQARRVRLWTYQELLDKADFVVIARPTATGDSQERLQSLSGMAQPVVGVETKFQVSAVLKGEKSTKEFVLHHYRPDGFFRVPNGPTFITFDPAKKRPYLLFLVREADGRYAPVVGQIDPALSGISELSHGDEPRLNNPNPSAAKAGDLQWGEAAQGVSVRLRADRSRFGLHETPSFTLDFRNEGSRNFRVFQSPLAGSFVVDGISFGWTRGLGGKASSPFPPGRAYEGIRVSLDDGWQGDHLSGGKLTPGKHTIQYVSTLWDANVWGKSIRMPVDPNNPIHVTCTSNPLEIEIRDTDERPAPAGDRWGTPVEGVSVSLSADHFAWTADEQPTFKAKARNQGQRNDLLFARSQVLGELEVDGTLYHFAGPIRVRSSAFPPGRQYDDILIMFSPAWQTQDGKPLQLGGGRHIVRFIASAEPLQKPDRSARVCARSNPVEINIEPGIGKRAALVKKYLPGCELRAVRRQAGDYESIDEVLMTPGGHDVDLDSLRRAWIGTGSQPGALPDYWHNAQLTALLSPLKIKIATGSEAEDIVRMILGVFQSRSDFESWAFEAERREDGWLVTPSYVGHVSQVRAQGPIELVMMDGALHDVRQMTGGYKGPAAGADTP